MVAHLDILNSIRKDRAAIKNKTDTRYYYYAFVEFATVTKNVNLAEKWKKFEDSKERNLQFVFLSIYTRMVKRLLAFIEA